MTMEQSKEILEKMASISDFPDELLQVVPQNTVRMAQVVEGKHNSSWDYVVGPNGKHYFSVCAEGLDSSYFRLYEYTPEDNTCKRLFGLEEVAITYPRMIRGSKIHSSFTFMPDGRLIFASHTTAAAPGHPRWMPFAYYNHLWEGFPGSNLLIYDPKTGECTDLGIPVPRESIYGGLYEKTTHSYYFFGYHRGHAYRFDLATRKVTDFGQATEYGTWRTIPGLDGNLYGTTPSGRLLRINIAKQRIEDIPFNFPICPELSGKGTNNKVMHYANHPNGKLYFTALSCKQFLCYNYATQKVSALERFVPAALDAAGLNCRCMGMSIDEHGVLWYICYALGFGAYLCRWDPESGKPAESMGLMGKREHILQNSFDCFVEKDHLYVSETNRSDPCAVTVFQIDLADVRANAGKETAHATDPIVYVRLHGGFDRYFAATGGRLLTEDTARRIEEFAANKTTTKAFRRTLPLTWTEEQRKNYYGDLAINGTHMPYTTCWVAKIWQEEGLYESRLVNMDFDDNDDVVAVVEKDGKYEKLTLRMAQVVAREEITPVADRDKEALAEKYEHLPLPHQAERNHLALANAECTLDGGIRLVGTQDGMLALILPGEKVFSLGAVCGCGPVHDLAVSPDGRSAMGVAGDKDDIGTIFRFDLDKGITVYGRLFFQSHDIPGFLGASNNLHFVAWRGNSIAIGAADRLNCVYRFELP